MAKPSLQATMKKRMAESQSTDAFVDEVYEGVFGKVKPSLAPQKTNLPLNSLHPFMAANIGFHPYSTENLQSLANDIRENGLLEEIIVRTYYGKADEYEILSGHNRVAACRLLEMADIPAKIVTADTERAITIATVTNLQRRQGLLPSERGWAYRALLEAKKCQGKRADLTSVQIEQKLNPNETTRDVVAQFFGVSPSNVQRDIRLTYLIPEFLKLVDSKKIKQQIGLTLSYFDKGAQEWLYQTIYQPNPKDLTDSLLRHIKGYLPEPERTPDRLQEALAQYRKPTKNPKEITFHRKKFEGYFAHIGDEKKLETDFLAFLEERYGKW